MWKPGVGKAAAVVGVWFAVASAHAQLNPSDERAVIGVITKDGNSCEQMTAAQGIAMIEGTDDFLLAVACSNGDRHVVRVGGSGSLNYVSSCSVFEATTDGRCFE